MESPCGCCTVKPLERLGEGNSEFRGILLATLALGLSEVSKTPFPRFNKFIFARCERWISGTDLTLKSLWMVDVPSESQISFKMSHSLLKYRYFSLFNHLKSAIML